MTRYLMRWVLVFVVIAIALHLGHPLVAGIITIVAAATWVSSFLIETGFVYVMTVKGLMDRGYDLPEDMIANAYIWLVVGTPNDVLFNLMKGTRIFKELPRWGEWMFSSRVQRHVDESDGWRKETALSWALVLNAIDPSGEHIKIPAGAIDPHKNLGAV